MDSLSASINTIQGQLIYKYYIFLVSGQVNTISTIVKSSPCTDTFNMLDLPQPKS
jgi:hypothetical protein